MLEGASLLLGDGFRGFSNMTASSQILAGTYDYHLVALSVLIAIVAAYAALDLAGRVTSARGPVRFLWLTGGATAMGIGIWSMHYIGMLAFRLPVPVLYDWPTVLVSLLAAIFASAIALFVVSRTTMGFASASIGSVFMGGGIASMHYIGMAAMRLPAMCYWSLPLVALSVVFAVVISLVAILLTRYFRSDMSAWSWPKILSAAVMGAAIPVMHYTGMAAATFVSVDSPTMHGGLAHTVSAGSLSVAAVSIVTFMVLGIAVITSLAGRRFAVQAMELETSRRYHQIIEAAFDAFVGTDSGGLITDWNAQAEAMFGWSRSEAVGKAFSQLIIPERDRDDFSRQLLQYFSSNDVHSPNKHAETTLLHRDENEFPVEMSISIIRWGGKHLLAAFVRDVTERKVAEGRVQAQLGRLNLLHQITRAIGGQEDLQSIYEVVLSNLEENLGIEFGCVCDYDEVCRESTVIHVGNRSQAHALKLAMKAQARIPTEDNGLQKCVSGELLYEPDTAGINASLAQRFAAVGLRSLVVAPLLVESKVFGFFVAARGAPKGFSTGECEFLRQLSEHVALAARQAQLHAALQRAYDDLRQTQQAVMQQERLRALGQMASGVAHDINNAISPLMVYVEILLQQETGLSAKGHKYLQTMQRAVDDVARTVSRMQDFYRQRDVQLTLAPVDMNELIQQVIDLTRARWSDMPQQQGVVIETRTDLKHHLSPVLGVESELREALVNLVFNAVDAMPGGGALTIRTSLTEFPPQLSESIPTQKVIVEVTDTGIGMDEKTRRRSLEPFFTTKGERGTGLGLAMVYGVMQRHGGDIEIESAAGKGTTVRLTLRAESVAAQDRASVRERSVPRSRLRVLVVDDDPLLLNTLRDALEVDGHHVVTANGGQAGIDAFRAAHGGSETFAAVITDLGMPRVDGRQVALAIKTVAPSTPVILLTGWGQRLLAEGDIPPHVDLVLSKPPKLHDLREALRSVCAVQSPVERF